jgi:hypothetical protein
MDNHFHQLLETPESNLSQTGQWLNVSYSMFETNRSGPIVLAIGCGETRGYPEEFGGEPCRKDGTGSGETGAVLDGKWEAAVSSRRSDR